MIDLRKKCWGSEVVWIDVNRKENELKILKIYE